MKQPEVLGAAAQPEKGPSPNIHCEAICRKRAKAEVWIKRNAEYYIIFSNIKIDQSPISEWEFSHPNSDSSSLYPHPTVRCFCVYGKNTLWALP